MSHYRILCPPAPPRTIPWWSQPYEIKLQYMDSIDFAQVVYNGILDLICWGLWIVTVFKRGGSIPSDLRNCGVALAIITVAIICAAFKVVRKKTT